MSQENPNFLLYDCNSLIDETFGFDCNFAAPNSDFNCPLQTLDASNFNLSAELDGIYVESEGTKENTSKKRFMELGSILEPGRPPKNDKVAILNDAIRMVTQLRGESQNLKDSNSNLQEKIKELKVEKNELRDEKQRLKANKDKLEQQLKTVNTQPGYFPTHPPIPAAFGPPVQAPGGKLVPFMGYPGVAMWQFMPPAAVDTSQDHVLRPPVA